MTKTGYVNKDTGMDALRRARLEASVPGETDFGPGSEWRRYELCVKQQGTEAAATT